MKKLLVIAVATIMSLCLVLPAAAQPTEDEYPLFNEYKQYLLDTLMQDSFWQGKEAQLKADLDAALDPDAECIKNFTGTADVDQAPPGVVFPMAYEEWFAQNGAELPKNEEVKVAAPGTYTDGTNTMVIEEDNKFVLTTIGQNMEGQEFALTVKGEISKEGELSITGVFDGDLDLTQLASEDQIKENLEIAKAVYEIALKETAEKGESPEGESPEGESAGGSMGLQTEEYEITVGDVTAMAYYEDLASDSEKRSFKITFEGNEYFGKIDKGVWTADDPSGEEVIAAYQAAHEADPNFQCPPPSAN